MSRRADTENCRSIRKLTPLFLSLSLDARCAVGELRYQASILIVKLKRIVNGQTLQQDKFSLDFMSDNQPPASIDSPLS